MTKSLTIGKVFQDTYVVTECVGEGGMGVVYEVSHLRLERKFAIKVLVKEAASKPEALARFQREAKVTSALGHPHIVEIVDFNVGPDGCPYIVMELLDGESLAARLRRVGRLELSQASSITRQTTSALHAAHQKGVIHRDLKPENIFLCKHGIRDDYVKLLDFGISKVIDSKSGITRNETLIGSPAYMAPELVRKGSAKSDVRADVYSMGVVLYQMLSGSVPYTADTIYNLLYKIVNEDPPCLGALHPDIPPPVEAVVSRAMRKNPDQRHSSVGDFWRDLALALEDLDVDATELIQVHHTAWPEDGVVNTPAPVLTGEAAPQPAAPPAGYKDTGASTTKLIIPSRRRGRLALMIAAVIIGLGALTAAAVQLHRLRAVAPVTTADAGPVRPPPAPDAAQPRDLEPVPDAAAPDTSGRALRPAAPDAPRTTTTVERVAPAMLRVGTLPAAADLYLNGRKVGQSPLVLRRLKPGRYVLDVRKGARRKRVVITLRPGQRRTASVVLDGPK